MERVFYMQAQPVAFRMATKADIPVILQFIRALAEYEHMEEEVVATPQLLEEWIFEKQKAEGVLPPPAIICQAENISVQLNIKACLQTSLRSGSSEP